MRRGVERKVVDVREVEYMTRGMEGRGRGVGDAGGDSVVGREVVVQARGECRGR